MLGRVTACDPSFGVLSARTVGNVLPPSVERRMRTLAVLMGERFVFATFQLTVSWPPPDKVISVFGCVTTKGPAPPQTLMGRSSSRTAVPPPPARLSRTETVKFITPVP